MSFDKVQPADHFVDLSDYARPIARRVTRALVNTRITPIQITLAYTLVGLIAALLLATGAYLNGVIAGALLLVKSMLDAVDGSLARARKRPSRVGRFLDSICDYVVNAAVLCGLALDGGSITIEKVIVAFVALECATWQSAVFNYYYVYYRKLTGGDATSQLNENEAKTYPWDNPHTLQALLNIYLIIYGWQDVLLGKLDRAITPDRAAPVYRDKRLLTATTAMGTGFQLLMIAIAAWLGQATWALWLFIGPMNLYWAIIMAVRYRKSRP